MIGISVKLSYRLNIEPLAKELSDGYGVYSEK
jgi:hypothetical protein